MARRRHARRRRRRRWWRTSWRRRWWRRRLRAAARAAAAAAGGGKGGGHCGSWWKSRRPRSTRIRYNLNNPLSNANTRLLLPKLPESATTNQQVMYMLADGTGGFVIHDTNDLAGGLDKIGKELNEHYVLGYSPTIRKREAATRCTVKVEPRWNQCPGAQRILQRQAARSAGRQPDRKNAGSARRVGPGRATSPLPCSFRSSTPATNTARVNVAMDFRPTR